MSIIATADYMKYLRLSQFLCCARYVIDVKEEVQFSLHDSTTTLCSDKPQ